MNDCPWNEDTFVSAAEYKTIKKNSRMAERKWISYNDLSE